MSIALDPAIRWRRGPPCELRDGYYVNLGIGIPTLVANYVPAEHGSVAAERERHARASARSRTEDEVDADLIDAGKQTVTTIPGSSIFSSDQSFGDDPWRQDSNT
jgi:3-oxoacid CoA-transferase subunit B